MGEEAVNQCPRCGGADGAHYTACVFANIFQRIVGPEYPLFGPTQTPGLDPEVLAALSSIAPLREQLAAMRRDLDAAIDAITRPTPPTLIGGGDSIPPQHREEHQAPIDTEQDAEPPPAETDTDWSTFVRQLRKQRGWTQLELSQELGCTHPLVGFWERGKYKPGPTYQAKLRDLQAGLTTKRRLDNMRVANDAKADKAATTLRQAIENDMQPAPDKWMPSTTLLESAQKIDPNMTMRHVGMAMRVLGFTEKRQIRIDEERGAPVHYRGLAPKEDTPTPAPEPERERSLEEQMAERRAAETAAKAELPQPTPVKERYRYDGPRPGGELYQEYRDLLEPLWSVPGWSYAPNNPNGGGKPRVTNPEGTQYVLPNTPSDVRAIKNTRAALRRLGAPI